VRFLEAARKVADHTAVEKCEKFSARILELSEPHERLVDRAPRRVELTGAREMNTKIK